MWCVMQTKETNQHKSAGCRISAHLFTQEEQPCGRLVPLTPHYDSQTQIIEFLVPSHDPKRKERVYGLEIDARTGECACACEDFFYRRAPRKNIVAYGTYLEQIALLYKGKQLKPLITRKPSGLCPHARRARQWLKRHDIYQHIETAVEILAQRVERECAA